MVGDGARQIVWGQLQKSLCYRTERVLPPALAGPNTEHRELQWRSIGYFMMNGATPENRKLMLKRTNFPMACELQII